VESNSTDQPPSNNPAASTASTENPPEDFREEENFDLIKRYWTDPEAASSPQDYNPDPLEAVGRVSKKIVQCINLVHSKTEWRSICQEFYSGKKHPTLNQRTSRLI